MLTIKKLGLAAILAVGISLKAHALSITPATFPQFTGTDNSNLSAAQISAIVGVTVIDVYKQDQGGSESGSFGSSYNTSFNDTPTDPSGALIDYISGPSITGSSIFLYVKDGNANPAFYIFNLSALGWNGTDDLVLSGFWPQQGAISHITILTGTQVPDAGGTLALLGLAIGSLGLVRRKFSTQ
jgi:hypothetical protein